MYSRSSVTPRRRHRVLGALGAVGLLLSTLVLVSGVASTVGAPPAAAAPGTPGTPGAPVVVYQEDFENGTGTASVGLAAYTGAGGRTYTADGYWLDYGNCNGVIVQYAGTTFSPGHCNIGNVTNAQNNVRRLADVLGQVHVGAPGGTSAFPTNSSTAATRANHAVTAWTSQNSGADNLIQFRTTDLDLVTSTSRYYSVAVDVAEASCGFLGGVNNSKLDFYFNTGGGDQKVNASPIRACTDSATGEYTSPDLPGGWINGGNSVRAGHYYSDGSSLLSPAQMANLVIGMRNETGQQAGNDSAFDNLQLVDTTPQLDKAFSPTVTRVGQSSTLTLTVTNRADLGSKLDWGLTDTLPDGLVVAPVANIGGTCVQRGGAPYTVTAASGGSSIVVAGGDLAAGQASCTVTVDVTSTTGGSYTNDASNISGVAGLDAPGPATVKFLDPAITLTKDADLSSLSAVGDTITYTLVATNTGLDTLTGVAIADPLTGLSALDCSPAAPAVLAPGAKMTCTATKDATQADLDAGVVDNTASVTGTDPGGGTVTDTDPATVPVTQQPAISITKSAAPTTFDHVGQVIAYTFVGTNTGNVTLTNAKITDPLAGLSALTCTPAAPAALAPGDTISCTATRAVTQADLDVGVVDNTASIVGTPPTGPNVTDADDATVAGSQAPAIDLVKSVDPASFAAPGDTLHYSFVATNVGNTTLTGVEITDPHPGLSLLSCSPSIPATLAPGAKVTCSATYLTTQADLDAGRVDNTATVAGTGPAGQQVTDTDTASVPAPRTEAIALTKDPDRSFFTSPGQTITYSFVATNIGNTTLTGVTVSDPLPGLSALACTPATPATVAPGDSVTCTATKQVTQADLDAGTVDNTATTRGVGPDGATVKDTASASVPGTQTPEITIVKSADLTSYDAVGQTITYTFVGTNTGNVTLTGVRITDPLTGLSALSCTPTQPTTLAPGDEVRCTATKKVSQADLDAGSVDNTATIAGTDPQGTVLTDTDSVTVPGAQIPAVSIVKSADRTSYDAVGQTITYSFVGTNTGNVTLSGVAITDPLPGLSVLSCSPSAPAVLAPGETVSCTATKKATQADLDAGSVDNTATIAGTDPAGSKVTDADDAIVPADGSPAIDLVKTADATSFAEVGDVITYTFVATNVGTVTLSGVEVTDPLPGLSALTCSPSTPAKLAPGAAVTCTATKEVTQANLDHGELTNTATATGTDAHGTDVTDKDTVVVPGAQTPAISIVKSADRTSYDAVDQTITYSFVGTNTGNVTLTGVAITDPLAGLSALSCSPSAPATLAPGAKITCTATKEVSQADLDAGSVDNTATIAGSDPTGTTLIDVDDAHVPGDQAPAIDLVKTADKATYTQLGEQITYSFVGTNTGNVTLDHVEVTDPMPGLSALSCNPAAPATIAPEGTITCTATYVVTQADLDAGHIDNAAAIGGTDPTGDPVDDTDEHTVPGAAAPALDLVKSTSSTGVSQVGEEVPYVFVATNTGGTTLHDVVIEDPHEGLSELSCKPAMPATLAPGDAIRCTATYAATQSDLDRGSIDNTATVTGTDPKGAVLTDEDSVTVPTTQVSSLELDKRADRTVFTKAGEKITYTFVATNTGNTTIEDVAIDDPLPGLGALTCTPKLPTSLAPGDDVTCTATYTTTEADVEAGGVVNVAVVTGKDPHHNPVDDDDTATVDAEPPAVPVADTSIDRPPAGRLPYTGANVVGSALVGLALIGSGWALVAAGRRRQTA